MPLPGKGLAQRILALENRRRSAESAGRQMGRKDSVPRRQPHAERTRVFARIVNPGEQTGCFLAGKTEGVQQGIASQAE